MDAAAAAGGSSGGGPAGGGGAAAPPAAAHVHLVDASVDLSHEELSLLAFDDATQQLLAVKGGHVFAYAADTGALRWMYPLQEGPPVAALRPSLDNRMLAVQRGPCLLELIDLATGNCFVHSTHKGRDRVLGFFFSDAPGADLVVVTDRGVEMNAFAAKRQGLKLHQRVRRRSDWCLYTHETRMLIVGSSGPQGSGTPPASPSTAAPQPGTATAAPPGVVVPSPVLSSWQFTTAGTLHLPLFELHGPLPASAAAREFMVGQPEPAAPAAAPAGAAAASPAARAPRGQQQQQQQQWADASGEDPGAQPASAAAVTVVAAAGDTAASAAARRAAGVWLLRMYGRVYLAHAAARGGAPGGQLELYRFYSDTLLLERVYDLVTPQVDLSVVDNALVIHYAAAAVASLADVALPGRQPLTHPLPIRRLTRLPSGGAPAPVAAAGSGAAAAGRFVSSDTMHAPGWRLLMPNLVLDASSHRLHRLHLDLASIAESVSDWPALVGFLMRRRPSPAAQALAAAGSGGAGAAGGGASGGGAAGGGSDPRALLLGVCRSALQETVDLALLRSVFRRLVQAYADALARTGATRAAAQQPAGPGATAASGPAAGAPAGGPAAGGPAQRLETPPAVTVLSPSELAESLFGWAHDEEVVDALYLQAAVSEYCAAAEAAGVPTPPALACLRVELLLQQGLAHQALQLLRAQPSALGLPLASRLAAEGACGAGAGDEGGACGGAKAPGLGCQMVLEVYARQAAAEARAAARAGNSATGADAAAAPRGSIAAAAAAVAGIAPAAAAAAAGAAALSAAGQRRALAHSEAYVQQLVASGQLLRAARMVRDRGLAGGAAGPDALLRAAAAAGDARLFAALHRVFGSGGVEGLGGVPEGVEAAMARMMPARSASAF